ncbi:hypothetical protein KP509_11G073600 [Ceratopteris richardii]|uniref:Alpha-1,4 glucan phosphorylase n=1 Tax=Ceratopteris richardii TaxID=49495 RepID=A0A8T2TW07_CERRI|nr:hypothetical protein KP509_11G073600 [Ceratopteris richardii]
MAAAAGAGASTASIHQDQSTDRKCTLRTRNEFLGSPRTFFLGGTKCPTSLCSWLFGNSSPRRQLSIQAVASEPKPKTTDGNGYLQRSNLSNDAESIAKNIIHHAEYSPFFSPLQFELQAAYIATAQSVRDTLIRNWNETYRLFQDKNPKQAYYLSMEFLQGRALLNAVGNLELKDAYAEALNNLGYTLETVIEKEPDAALGNGGLGRLASCFLDSLATLNLPAWGYGLRYRYGLFHQKITKEGQEEVAESWLESGNPWEIPRLDISYPIKFFGEVVEGSDGRKQWVNGENIRAIAYDLPIPGYKTKNTINLRLWSTSVPAESFNLSAFNAGHHDEANQAHANAAKICNVLYPGDDSKEGKILRLKQQYTLCSASLQDIIFHFKERSKNKVNWSEFPNKVAIQMNDTHPTLSVPELMRILVDLEGLSWEEAWNITQKTVAYTNHTVLPEALERWPLEIMKKLLPRHVEIIEKIDEQFLLSIVELHKPTGFTNFEDTLKKMRILENVELPPWVTSLLVSSSESEEVSSSEQEIDEDATSIDDSPKVTAKVTKKPVSTAPGMVRMANLCVIAGHTVNGVAAIHSEIVKNEVFNDFYKIWPNKFQNKTNGVTPRRWLYFCNPELSKVITKWLGSEDWVLRTDDLTKLRQFAENDELQKEWREAKRIRKLKLAAYIKEKTGYTINPDALFDIQVKRIHEYKRQFLNILGIVYRYKKMKEMTPEERRAKYTPRVCIFGGKAFATYVQAKRIVRLITDVGAVINNDPEIGDLLKVIFVPDYNVSVAEILIPASELSEHISTAGMEASGTSNMKFAMNGCVLIGTLDGANVEIRECVGEENFFLFGAYAHEIAGLRQERREGKFKPDPRFEEAKAFIRSGAFGKYDYTELLGSLEGNEGFGRGDYFLVGKDFPAYIECQDLVDKAYKDVKAWTKMSILNTAGSGMFSSDRTILQYANEIWSISPLPVP